jgi:hypothetical protein
MREIKQIINKINNDLKIIKKTGYHMNRIFIKLDENEFKKDRFEINNIPVVYGKVNNKEHYKIISVI